MTVLKRYTKRLAPVVMAIALMTAVTTPANAATFTDVSLQLSNPVPSATSNGTFTLSNQTTATTVRCVRITFNTAANGSGATPVGFSATTATLSGTFLSSWAGWTASNSAGVIQYTNATGAAPQAGAGRTLVATGLTNGSTADTSYYAIMRTFTNDTCTTGVDEGVTAFVFTDDTQVSVIVDPTFSFTVSGRATVCNAQSGTNFQTGSSGTAVQLGRINAATTGGGAQDLAVTTNAGGGFSVFTKTTGSIPHPLRSGSFSINDVAGTNATPGTAPAAGTEGFGYTVGGTHAPGQFGANQFALLDTTNRSVMTGAPGTMTGASCVGYQAAAAGTTEAGLYTADVVYTAVPVF